MLKPAAIVGQIILYGAFAAFIGYFATSPRYKQIPDDVAVIKVSVSHLGDRACRKRTEEELAKMPRNMRAPMECPRERSDIALHFDMDGQPMMRAVMHPTGVAKDGVSTIYKRFEVKAGTHQLTVKLNDNVLHPGFKFVKDEQVILKPAQVLVIDFNPDKGGIFFQ